MRYWAMILVAVSMSSAIAQDVETTGPTTQRPQDSIRSYYIKRFPDYFFLYPVLKQRSLNFEMEKESGDRSLLTYKPNNSYNFGLGMYVFELGIEFAFAVPLDENSIELYGESDSRDYQLNVLGKKFGIDAFYQRYNGFYITDSNKEVPANTPFPQRSDILTRNFGLTGNYVFNHQRFSFRSAYNFAERQVFSKGSFLLFSSISSFRLTADSSIINQEQRQVFGEEAAFEQLRYATFSIAPGYTYSLVYQNFFLNGTLSVGPAHHWIRSQAEGDRERNDTAINSFVAARIALGYNGERLFGGISFMSQGSNVNFNDVRFGSNNGFFKILIGYRFNEVGILKWRVWDLLPEQFR